MTRGFDHSDSRRLSMKPRVVYSLSASLVLCAAAQAQPDVGKPLQFAQREPAFYAIVGDRTERADARSFAVLRERVILRLHKATIPEALTALEEQTALRFAFNPSTLPSGASVSLDARDITVAAALTQILLDADVDVELTSYGLASIVPRVREKSDREPRTGTVVGRVIDAKTGKPISYATVSVEGTGLIATTTDSGGFRLKRVPFGTHTITVRRLGYLVMHQLLRLDSEQSAALTIELQESPNQLDQVVVTGTVAPTEIRDVPTPVTVVTDSIIEQQNLRRVDQIFRELVPGAIAWEQGAYDWTTAITVRGQSSFGANTIKTYVDGVEVSDDEFTTIDPESVDHIEVIRGPEASTVYGSGATGGVMQVFTKRGDPSLGRPEVSTKVSLGDVQSPYKGGGTLRQDYGLSVLGGSDRFSYLVGGSYSHVGDWLPEYYSSVPSVYGGVHTDQGDFAIDISARSFTQSFAGVNDPAEVATGFTPFTKPADQRDQVQQQTAGAHVAYTPTAWWQHNLTLGFDKSNFGYYNTRPRLTTPSDTEMVVYENNESKSSIAYNTTVTLPVTNAFVAVITAGVDHYVYSDNAFVDGGALNNAGSITSDPNNPPTPPRDQYTHDGFFGQTQVRLANALTLTGGVRAERDDNFGQHYGIAVAPRVGAAYVIDLQPVSLKLRASYGQSIRAPLPEERDGELSQFQVVNANPILGPERQIGGDGGIDLYWGHRASLTATYYNQTAIDLIDEVLLNQASNPPVYQFQNVGRIRNTGAEFQGTLNFAIISLTAEYSIMHSRIASLSPYYTGDYEVGDRATLVPNQSAGGALTWRATRTTSATFALNYIGSWVYYDMLKLDSTFYGNLPFQGSHGLRDYWRTYPGFVKENLTINQQIDRRMSAFLSVENLGDSHAIEQYNTVPIQGRTTMLGFRIKY